MNTRTICDWTKSTWVLPHPETLEIQAAPDQHLRFIIATDGLWDVLSTKEAAQMARNVKHFKTAEDCAKVLLQTAKNEYRYRNWQDKEGRRVEFGDDTTVLVIDVPPTAEFADQVAKKSALGSRNNCLIQ